MQNVPNRSSKSTSNFHAFTRRNPAGHASPGSSIAHFAQLDNNVYVGSKPHTEQDFEFLQSQHIKYILNVRFLPFLTGSEKSMAKRHGISFISKPMNASFIPPRRNTSMGFC